MSMVQPEQGYRLPPKPIADLVDSPVTPDINLDPGGTWMLLAQRAPLLTIEDLARPELRLAGLRIDPAANAPSRSRYYTGMALRRVSGGPERPITGLPQGVRLGGARWSPDGTRIAFTVRDEAGIRLWVADVETAAARLLPTGPLNALFGAPFDWVSDSRTLICLAVPQDRGGPPVPPAVPTGPVVQESIGRTAPARTHQDLLKNAHDEALFEYYATSQVLRVTVDGEVSPIGPAGMIAHADPSPDGACLLVETIHRPFSYLVTCPRFPHRVDVWDAQGRLVRAVADLPLAEDVPIGFDAVPVGPRGFHWRADAPATLVWVEAQDRGDPRVPAEVRDRLYTLAAPFAGDRHPLASLQLRYAGLIAGSGDLALVRERWWKNRRERLWRLAPDVPGAEPRLLFDRSYEDHYGDPGHPLLQPTPAGTRVILTADEGRTLFLAGDGASPEGNRPFLDRYDLETGATERLFRSEPPYYERPVRLMDAEERVLLTLRESVQEPPNCFLRHLRTGELRAVTEFPHPMPALKDVRKELLRYQREDGVGLTATLYLPPGYSPEQGPLPVFMWAYPREYKSADAAGQVTTSPYQFVRIPSSSPLYFLAHGCAVLEGPTMPIIGEGDAEANDTYVEQLVASARAAVEEVVRRGVGDRSRVAIGGHSYGGFMTANLLAHSDLFRAGIARSGAYNRTLTPFGFQAEERTLWEAPHVYVAMSPFVHADRIKAPLLLIHGDADNNDGTFPMQSERLYNALKGHGATVRLVLLPLESHGYQARESVMHTLAETAEWLDRWVKRAE